MINVQKVEDIRNISIENIYTFIWHYTWFYRFNSCILKKKLNGGGRLIIFLFIVGMDKVSKIWEKVTKAQK